MGKQKHHSVDALFALVLFAVFAVSAMLLVLLGAGVYGRIGEKMNKMDAPMVLAYVTEKLRSSEGEALEDGQTLLLKETIEGETYVTWLYVEDGYLKESLMPEGKQPVENAGTPIAPVQEFQVEKVTDTLLRITVTDDFGAYQERYYD